MLKIDHLTKTYGEKKAVDDRLWCGVTTKQHQKKTNANIITTGKRKPPAQSLRRGLRVLYEVNQLT